MTRVFGLIFLLLISSAPAHTAEPTAGAGTPISAPSPQPQLTGTLFYSSQERAKLDKARRSGNELEPNSPAQAPLIINGMVKRSDGNTSVWVDGALVDPVSDTLAAKVSSKSVGHPDGLRLASSDHLTVTDRPKAKPLRGKNMKRALAGQQGK